jgi:hypothetical protein
MTMTPETINPAPESDKAAAHIAASKARHASLVQAIHQRTPDITRRPWESLAIFVAFTGFYIWFGYWMVVKMHIVGFETLDRLDRALMIWHNDPAKLSALGFDYPPLATLLISPLAIFPGVTSSLWAVPIASAAFAGLIMLALNTMMRRAQLVAPLRYAVLVALGANPLFLLYAAGGARQVIGISFVVVAMGAIMAWYITADVRFVMLAGIAFAVASLSGYGSLTWFVLTALMIGGILARLGADGSEVEGTTVGFAVPTAYVVALWCVFNLILLGKPFYWISAASDASGGGRETFTGLELLQDTASLVLYAAPIAIIVLPALIFIGIARNNPLALWFGVLLAAAIASPALSVALHLTDAPMQMRNALPIILFSVIGAIWIARSAGNNNLIVSIVLIVGLLASIPWTFEAMKTYRYQNLESNFAAAVSTRDSQEGATTPTGSIVGVRAEQAMAEYITSNITTRNTILTDNSQTYAVMLLTGQPDLFVDRVDKSDGPWKEIAAAPARYGIDYMVMSTTGGDDLLSQQYPNAADGSDPCLPVIYRTDRYVLLGVPANFDPDSGTCTAASSTAVTP